MKTTNDTELIRYATHSTRLGLVFAATTERGICMLQLIPKTGRADSLAELGARHPNAALEKDDKAFAEIFQRIDAWMNGGECPTVALDLNGTPFQQKVWRAMQRVPAGQTVTYSELARRAGVPKAIRATASACARNPVALFVPCHRIVRSDGGLGGYRWGLEHKRQLLEIEGAVG